MASNMDKLSMCTQTTIPFCSRYSAMVVLVW